MKHSKVLMTALALLTTLGMLMPVAGAHYPRDDYHRYARNQRTSSIVNHALIGAGAGALLGGLTAGDERRGSGAIKGAVVGGVLGGAVGYLRNRRDEQHLYGYPYGSRYSYPYNSRYAYPPPGMIQTNHLLNGNRRSYPRYYPYYRY